LLTGGTLGLPPDTLAGVAPPGGLPDYWRESRLLVEVPGASSSLAAGLFNPAAWAVRPRGGLLLAHERWETQGLAEVYGAGRERMRSSLGILSLRGLNFAVRRNDYRDAGAGRRHGEEYTLGWSLGSAGGAWGLSYAWNGGDWGTARHRRLMLGTTSRLRWISHGISSAFDLERDDFMLQSDLGLRPFGPRLTLFGEAVWWKDQDFEEIRTSYGFDLHPLRGYSLGLRVLNTGEIGARLSIGLQPRMHGDLRAGFDNDGERLTTSYLLETGLPAPSVPRLRRSARYPELKLKGPLVHRRYRYFDDRRTLVGTLSRIDLLAQDPTIEGIVLNLSQMRINSEMLWELREQLAGFRARGKKVIVYLESAGLSSYAFATVADEIWMHPRGDMVLLGLNGGRTYVRRLFDKLGVGVDEWRYFTYKSAFESFSRTSMSAADREQIDTLIDDFYEEIVATITAARGLSREAWERVVDEEGVLLASHCRAAGLIDSIGTYEEAKAASREAARRESADLSAAPLGAVWGDPVWGPMEWGAPPKIALLYGIGPCAMTSGIKGPELARKIRAAREDPQVKAVVFRVDSPGGGALPSDLVTHELKLTAERKPVIVSQGRVAGSGGYWISMYGDTIVASPYTITGSIGVIGGWLWDDGLGEKLGIDYDNVQRGAHADLGRGMRLPLLGISVPERNLTPEEVARIEKIFTDGYQEFVAMVAEGRGMSPEEVDRVGQGRIWSGRRGMEIGLVDEIGGLWHSLALAKQAAGIPAQWRIALAQGPSLGAFRLPSLRPRLAARLGEVLLGIAGSERLIAEPAVDGVAAAEAAEPEVTHWVGASSPEQALHFLRCLLQTPGRPVYAMEPLEIMLGGEAW
jgi:protease-4